MTTPSPRSPRRKHKSSGSLDVGAGDDGEDVGYAPDDEGADLPPGRMHVVNQQMARLQGKPGAGHHHQHTSSGSLSSLEGGGAGGGGGGRSPIIMNSAIGPAGGSTGAICPPSPRSTRSRSPLTQPRGTGPERNNDYMTSASAGKQGQGASEKNTNSTFDANSSISSLDDIVDQDILYDRAGLIDDLSQSSSNAKNRLHNSREGFTNLTPVTERLSEETLEDVHAFSDLNPAMVGNSSSCRSQSSRANSQATDREGVLAALDECAEEDEADNDDNESLEDPSESEQAHQEVILLTNMEKVDINAGHSRSEDDGDGFGGGERTSLAGTDVGVGGCAMGTATGESGGGAPPPAS